MLQQTRTSSQSIADIRSETGSFCGNHGNHNDDDDDDDNDDDDDISPGVRRTSLTDPGQEGERGGRRPLLSGGSSPQGGHISRGGPAIRPLMATDVEPGEKVGTMQSAKSIVHSAIKVIWEFS